MQLKQLEIKGFKSFSDKTIIHFNQSITGVVGPNGCGKSNIVDAIRWVLGEQSSKELRSDRMSSLIFNGTKNRRAAGLAEVTLTFINDRGILRSEYHEVSVTRILYRSGESEYRINQVNCRLKDIQHLFMDSGITSDSYAIIALDMVDALLQDRDNSRRKLFEQAAGISSYKIRKKETQNRLALTIQDLERAEDLMLDMAENLKSLEKQAKRAKSYFRLKKKFERLAYHRVSGKLIKGKADLENLNQHWNALLETFNERKASITSMESKVEALKLDVLQAEHNLKTKETALHEVKSDIRAKEQEVSHTRQFLAQGEKRRHEIALLLENGTSILQQHHQKIAELEVKQKEAREQEDCAQNKWQHEKIEKEQHTAKLAEIKQAGAKVSNELNALNQSYQKLNQQHTGLHSQWEERQRQLQKAQAENEQSQQEEDKWKHEIEKLSNNRKERETIILDLQRQQQGLEKQLQLFAGETERLKEQQSNIRQALSALENERTLTLKYIESLDGYTEAVKHIRKNYNFNKPAPFLSDILDCQPEYKLAIETYLRPWMDFFIVETRRDAIALINWLHQSGKGKTSVFVLEKIKGKAVLPVQPGLLNAVNALDIVSCENKYHALVQQLLAHVWISDELDETGYNMTLITRDGRFVQNALDISGGAVGLFEGRRIGGRKNIEKMDLRMNSLQENLKSISMNMNDLDDKTRNLKSRFLMKSIEREQAQIDLINRDILKLQSYIQENNRRRETRLKKLESESYELTEGKQKIAILEKEKTTLLKNIQQTESSFQHSRELLQNAQAAAEKASSTYNEAHVVFIQMQNASKSIYQELEFAKSREQQFEKQQKLAEAELKVLNNSLLKSSLQLEQLEESHRETCVSRDKMAVEIQNLEKAYFELREQLDIQNDNIKTENKEIAKLSELKAEIQSKREVLKHDLKNLLEKFEEVDADDLDQDEEDKYVDLDAAELEVAYEKASEKLKRFGEVNMLAVEAYESLKEKYDSMTEQKQDILEAKALLDKTMLEIEQTATKRFLDAFTQTRQHFVEVFQSLFSEGDTCDLLLENPNMPLESQINIIARPKGKRPLHINQLSGGEKTLTAIALLFSLYLLKPAPFCIFDEVDAPLDDANVLKFNNTIREFSNRSQFIIVTHNKLTMAEVDVIYGITMAEQGVSSVVPVNFSTLAKPEFSKSYN